MGAAQQLWLLYRNVAKISDLQNLRRSAALGSLHMELVENKRRRQSAGVTATFAECELKAHP